VSTHLFVIDFSKSSAFDIVFHFVTQQLLLVERKNFFALGPKVLLPLQWFITCKSVISTFPSIEMLPQTGILAILVTNF